MSEDEKWMKLAIIEAYKARSEDEIPVGALLIKNNKIISRAYNQPISKNDPTAHAEIQVIRKAGKRQKNYRLDGSVLYVTLEPCIMCLGAIINARIYRVVFGAFDNNAKVCDSCKDTKSTKSSNHKVIILGGVLENDCSFILQSFFKLRR